jgi:hypothetical protein
MAFELTNARREFFGLDPVGPGWEKVEFKGAGFRPDGVLYFDGDTIKRWIVSTEDRYIEEQFDELTEARSLLLPKTPRGKPLKLSASTLEKRRPWGVYLRVDSGGNLDIGNHTTQTTFYSTSWHPNDPGKASVRELIERFIGESPQNHPADITAFKHGKRRHVKFKPGDDFSLKLGRSLFGVGRILLDVPPLVKQGLIPGQHGLTLAMGHAVVVRLYARAWPAGRVPLSELQSAPMLPSGWMMDNALLYGEYEIVGHRDLTEEEFEFPLSYGQSIDARRTGLVFLQWGLIHLELPKSVFSKYLSREEILRPDEFPAARGNNPLGFYSIGFSPTYGAPEVHDALASGGRFDFDRRPTYFSRLDLRNPRNARIRAEIMSAFGLDPGKSYAENCRLTGTPRTMDILRKA